MAAGTDVVVGEGGLPSKYVWQLELVISPGGVIRCIYSEAIDLSALGSPTITRASHVEPDQQGRWWADLSPVSGPLLGPFHCRSDALAAEHTWLEVHWLNRPANERQVN